MNDLEQARLNYIKAKLRYEQCVRDGAVVDRQPRNQFYRHYRMAASRLAHLAGCTRKQISIEGATNGMKQMYFINELGQEITP